MNDHYIDGNGDDGWLVVGGGGGKVYTIASFDSQIWG